MKKLNKVFKIGIIALTLVCGTALAGYSVCGDANKNGSTDIIDALVIAQYSVGLSVQIDLTVADVNTDGSVNIIDALKIAQYSVGTGTLLCGTPPPPITTPPTGTNPPREAHQENPFTATKWYVNSDWAANAAANGGASIAKCSTAVWIDRIAAIAGTAQQRGIRAHLDDCLAQGANLIYFVIYDLPNRDCNASASNGELLVAQDGINKYKTLFIDALVPIITDAKYGQIRIVCQVEDDAIPNLITNLSVAKCAEADSSGAYVTGIQYCINKLLPYSNIYMYLDIAHSAWLGWPDNFPKAMTTYTNLVKNTTNGLKSIDGFIDNTANTLPLTEPFINKSKTINGQALKNSKFYDWNPYICELDYVNDFYTNIVAQGFPSNIGMVIDTGRNGWGGVNRPKAESTNNTDINVYVDQSRIDRRFHRGNWCNQSAGIGERPKASPATHIDAYVWVKPPGESDGVSSAGIIDPDDPNKTFDKMCDPNGVNTYCSCGTTGAMAGGPHAGKWFPELFKVLLANAYPPIN